MNDLVISLAVNGRESYEDNLTNLKYSIIEHWPGQAAIFNYFPEFVTPHKEMPYKFKYDLIRYFVNHGFTRIFWLDSTMRLRKNIAELFDQTNTGIVSFHNEGHPLYKYIHDDCLRKLEVTDRELFLIKQVWGGAIGFDFNKIAAQAAFKAIEDAIEMGCFKEASCERRGFVAHRHDQAVASIIFDRFHVKLFDYGVIASKVDIGPETYIQYGD